MVEKPDKEKEELKQTKKKIYKVILIGYIIILLLGLYVLNIGRNEGLNSLYNELEPKCYNYDELRENNNFNVNEEYVIGYHNLKYGKYNCSVTTKTEFDNMLSVEDGR